MFKINYKISYKSHNLFITHVKLILLYKIIFISNCFIETSDRRIHSLFQLENLSTIEHKLAHIVLNYTFKTTLYMI